MTLPIQLINGSLGQPIIDLSMAGVMTRVSCAVVGVLLAENRSVKTLKLSRTGLGASGVLRRGERAADVPAR